MKNTLEYLLAIANYDAPELQRSIFEERANVDFAYLLDNRYLVENGRFGSSVFEMGEPVRVFRNPYDGKFYYLMTAGHWRRSRLSVRCNGNRDSLMVKKDNSHDGIRA